jgi:hypothetical protein
MKSRIGLLRQVAEQPSFFIATALSYQLAFNNPEPDEPEPKKGYDVSLADVRGGPHVGEKIGGTARGKPAWSVVLFSS